MQCPQDHRLHDAKDDDICRMPSVFKDVVKDRIRKIFPKTTLY
jgi:hypothetical protein